MTKNTIAELDPVPGNNTTIDDIDASGATGKVKDGDNLIRSLAGMLAQFYDDIGGVVTVGGTANAVTIVTSAVYASLATGMRFMFTAASANTGAATLNLDSIGAKAIRKISGGTDVALAANDILAGGVYELVYDAAANSAAGAWILVNPNAAKLNVAQTWTAAQTFTAAFTSLGIDDNATAERLQLADSLANFGTAGATYTLAHAGNDSILFLQGGNAADTGAGIRLYGSTHATDANDTIIRSGSSQVYRWDDSAGQHLWYAAAGTQRLTMDATEFLYTGSFLSFGARYSTTGANQGISILGHSIRSSTTVTTSATHAQYINGNGPVGSITTNASATAYNTSSDYRLKADIADLSGSGAFIDALRPRSFTMGGVAMAGFVAHEFAAVSPMSVTGEKDAVDEDGNPIYQAMQASTSEVMAHVIAELQSLRARVAVLEAQLI
jgi:hypothetical protein